MIRRSATLRSIAIAPLLFCVLIACRQAAAYTGGTYLQAGTLTLSSNSVLVSSYQPVTIGNSVNLSANGILNTNGNVINLNTNANPVSVFPTPAPPPPQLEIIALDKTGHPLNGIPDTYQPKYDEGYKVGYAGGYDSGFVSGKQRGTDEGTTNGQSDGYNKGFGESYQPAFDLAYNTQLPIGEAAGWNQGQVNGFAKGYDWAPTIMGSVTVSNGNHYGGGVWGSVLDVTMYSDNYGGNSNRRYLLPEEVPAFYYKLGLDDGNTIGVSEGSAAGYKVTYPDAYAAAFPIGYQNGTVEGTSQGSVNGEIKGFNAGWDLGYGPGFDSGFEAGIQHYLSGQPSSSFGTLSIELGGLGLMAPPSSLSLGDVQAGSFGSTSGGSSAASDTSVPEPTSVALLSVAIGAIILRRAGRK
jgi:hypothetical protein